MTNEESKELAMAAAHAAVASIHDPSVITTAKVDKFLAAYFYARQRLHSKVNVNASQKENDEVVNNEAKSR